MSARSAASRLDKRLVEQEDLRLAHDGAADGDALALAAGEHAGLLLQPLVEVEDARRLARPCGGSSSSCAFSTRSGKAMFSKTVMCG